MFSRRGSSAASGPRKPGQLAQMRQAFDLTRRNDPKLVPYMLLAFFGSIIVLLAVGLLVKNWITFLILGIVIGALAAMIILSLRAQNAALTQLEGQPGGARAAMSLLRRGWIMPEEPVAVNPRSRDLIFRAVGRPGVVLVTEGPTGRVQQIVNAEKTRMRRILPDVPIHVIHSGTQDGQVKLQDLPKTMRALPAKITKDEVVAVDKRLTSIGRAALPIPKGVDPTKARASRKGLRGR
ncbi:DUF4191 domain-containing protein [Falsarthrobacter nasiphocae]